jgi:PTS system mannose-specific IIC component
VTLVALLCVLLWGVVVAMDLASVPQGLLSRPLVAATVTGALVGAVELGLLVGAVLELYALDVMPVGAARYPDLGAASVPATIAATQAPLGLEVGIAGLIGLPLAVAGGWGLHVIRRRSAVAIAHRRARVAAGDARAIWELQRGGLLRDAARGLAITSCGLGAMVAVGQVPLGTGEHGWILSAAVVAGGLAAAAAGAMRRGGAGARRRWLGVGLATGLIVVLWR